MVAAAHGKVRPLAVLGQGGMATVYLAASEGPGGFAKLVVLKELRSELANELEFCEMFLDEARLAARLNHPNIVQTYEVVEGQGQFVIVMEYLEGQPLSTVRARMLRDGRLTLADHVRIIADMLDGLHAAHEAKDWDGRPLGVVHRDVSPHNVFVTYEGQVKIVDFGVAKAATSLQQTGTGIIKGKIAYMSPEQALGRTVDRRADIFAAGIMLWEAVAGRRLWKELPDATIVHFLDTGAIPSLTDVVPDADPALVRVCARALAPLPDDRYWTAAEMRADLEVFLAACPSRSTARAFGLALAEAFASNRTKIRMVIEAQMSHVRAMSSAEHQSLSLPQLPLTDTSASGAGAVSAASRASMRDPSPLPGAPWMEIALPGLAQIEIARPESGAPTTVTTSGMLALGGDASAPPAVPPPRRSMLLRNMVLLALLGLLTLAAVILLRLRSAEVPGAPALPAAASSGVSPSPSLAVPPGNEPSAEPSAAPPRPSSKLPPPVGPRTEAPRPRVPARPGGSASGAPTSGPSDIILNR